MSKAYYGIATTREERDQYAAHDWEPIREFTDHKTGVMITVFRHPPGKRMIPLWVPPHQVGLDELMGGVDG